MKPALTWQKKGTVRFLTDAALVEQAGIRVAFTSRVGGVSNGPYASLNLAFHVGDASESIIDNRRTICEALTIDVSHLTCGQQVHGTHVAVVEENEVGRGHADYEDSLSATDAMATSVARAALSMFFADCVPVVVVDAKRRAVGVAHAGWKGVAGNVVGALVERMREAFDTVPAQLTAYVGPSIGPCCYEVDRERAALFARMAPQLVKAGARHIDLAAIAAGQLDCAGVPGQNVAAAGICTADNTDVFYSYRGEEGVTGRHAAIVSIGY